MRIIKKFNKTFIFRPESKEDFDEIKKFRKAVIKGTEGKWSQEEKDIVDKFKNRPKK
ncbi:hypothetical protein [Alkalibacillus almallahensis]|uniref:hypothetical protein n=1 Tax=Alkalibacillus almallahensis TaxID=1379154 RepID=UPI0014244051|nr:hypothetical protein [Alkalibacillus almallahensis]NIK12171.1 hypothetical protein [Alkalibacillus almallahensis]